MSRPRDHAYEALAEATGTDMQAGRGALNAALKSIREQSEIEGEQLADEIRARARMYRQVFPEVALTPPALAKHWLRVFEEAQRTQGTNRAVDVQCEICGGDRFVIVNLRAVGEKDVTAVNFEEWAPCPNCNPNADTGFYRPDGSRFRSPDPAAVRDILRRA